MFPSRQRFDYLSFYFPGFSTVMAVRFQCSDMGVHRYTTTTFAETDQGPAQSRDMKRCRGKEQHPRNLMCNYQQSREKGSKRPTESKIVTRFCHRPWSRVTISDEFLEAQQPISLCSIGLSKSGTDMVPYRGGEFGP